MSLIIVAVPARDEYVWNISSEKVPHMTLLHLGDLPPVEDVRHIIEFVAHATNISLYRFGLSVSHRTELGDDDADVLIFEERGAFKTVDAFRTQLLSDTVIRRLHGSTEQFPKWIPHLTLGYPETPAKKDQRDFPKFNYIEFDRIDVWTGDFAGTEFLLKSQYLMEDDMSMADVGRNFLEHHGVKGMRWGVRRSQATLDKAANRSEGGKSSGSDDAPNAGRSGGSDSGSGESGANSRAPQKSVQQMSDKELKAYVNRLNMEQQFARMQPTPFSKKAAKFAGEVLVGVARQQLTNQLNNQLSEALAVGQTARANKASAKATTAARKAGVPDAPRKNPFTSTPDARKREG